MHPTRLLMLAALLTASPLLGCLGLPFVGRANLTLNLSALRAEAEIAMAVPLEPGQGTVGDISDQGFTPFEYGRTYIFRKPNGDRLVIFDRGGGHLGHQGYVYAPYAESSAEVHRDAFGDFEGRKVWKMYGNWWAYDSTEE
ncbi:MAG: hypothetical protein VXW32_12930 [Myxococcota bacterium]|nr:hypothetical protein [Myxococcota bacterium]